VLEDALLNVVADQMPVTSSGVYPMNQASV